MIRASAMASLGLLCAGSLLAGRALGAPVVAFAPPGVGQGGLAVGFDAAGALRAATCGASLCSIEHGTEVLFPAELRPAIPGVQFSVVGIGAGRRAIVVSASDAHAGRAWSAVLVAPLVEETVFRGYLYPLFAKSLGVAPGIVITGVLFGLMHGSQLGWTWGLVLLLTFVGIIFTFARARTGTVLASFLLHLGYNSMIAVSSIIATKGFQHMPLQP